MSNYSDTEIEGAVSRFVRSELKTERDPLGPLNVDYTFQEVREFVASTLVFDPSAVFYLLSLAANRVNQDVLLGLSYLEDLRTAIQEVGGFTTKVTQTNLLADASAALIEADRQITEKNALTERPLSRYNKALDDFANASLSPNIKKATGAGFPDTYEIVRPPQQARSAIRSNIDLLRPLHTTIISQATQLTESLEEFLAANLPLVAIQDSVSKVRADLDTLKISFDGATTDGAIEQTRDAFLSIEAGRSVIDNLSTVTDPRDSRMKGTATTSDRAQSAYVLGYSTSTPAGVETSLSAPYTISAGVNDELQFDVDGATVVPITLVPADPASIICSNGETYDLHEQQTAYLLSSLAGPYTIPAVPDNVFVVIVDGVEYSVTVTPGVISTAALAVLVTAATRTDGQPGTLGAVAAVSDAGGFLRIDHLTAGAVHDIVVGGETAFNAIVGYANDQDSDDLPETRGIEANNVIRFIADDQFILEITLTPGPARTAAQVALDVFNGGGGWVTGSTHLSGSLTVVVVSSLQYGGGSMVRVESTTDTHRRAVGTLGFYEGQVNRSKDFSLDDLFDAVDAAPSLNAERSRIVIASGGEAEVLLSGADYVFRVAAGVLSGTGMTAQNKLRIIGGENAGYYKIQGISFGVTYDEIETVRAFPVVTGDAALNQVWEIVHDTLDIQSAAEDKTSSIEAQVVANSANNELGLSSSLVYGTVSGVKVKDEGIDQSFTRNDVRVGDRLTFAGPTYDTVHTVWAITESGYQIEVTPEVPNDLVNHLYVIESGSWIEYNEFIGLLGEWFSEELQGSGFEEDILELERLLNPLLVNKNPSSVRINDADIAARDLEALYSSLSIPLAGFVITPSVFRIDSLLNMLRERGLRRAHDLLLLGEFEEFFALTKDGASYGGNFLENMRSIAQNDVPIGRTEAEDHTDSRLTGSFDDVDYDLDFSDADNEAEITETDDIPDPNEEDEFLNEIA